MPGGQGALVVLVVSLGQLQRCAGVSRCGVMALMPMLQYQCPLMPANVAHATK